MFNTVRPSDVKKISLTTMQHSRPVESGRCDGAKHVMFAHVLATLGTHPVVTDADMAMPENWRDSKASKGSPLGHQSSGRTICLHSFIVCTEVQGVGIGKTVMKSYLELMNASGMADRVAIICQPVSNCIWHLEKCAVLISYSTQFSSTSASVSKTLAQAQKPLQVKAGMQW